VSELDYIRVICDQLPAPSAEAIARSREALRHEIAIVPGRHTISPEARDLAIAAIDIQHEAESRPLTTRIRTETNDPSIQLLLAEIVLRLDRIESQLPVRAGLPAFQPIQ
jgi:hypothetical protein